MNIKSSAVHIKKAAMKRKLEQKTAAEVSSEEPREKINFSENKMDPLEYFSRFLGIPEMIFDHFNGKDLIKISEVNPSYYNFIASSKALMEKIEIVFNEDRWLETSEDSDLLKNSSRLYQNIEIRRDQEDRSCQTITNLELQFFLKKSREWKNVSFREVCFKTKLDLWKMLSSIETSVESLSLTDCLSYPTFDEDSSDIKSFGALKFPKLKELKLHFYCYSDFNETFAAFLSNSVSIETLDMHGMSDYKNVLRKILKNNDKLKTLELGSDPVELIFNNKWWKRFQFKLKNLWMTSLDTSALSDAIISRNFRNFLKSQSDNLEELSISFRYDKEIFDVIMKLPKLKILYLGEFCGLPENEIPRVVSTSITNLKVAFLNVDCWEKDFMMKFFIKSMPNAKTSYKILA